MIFKILIYCTAFTLFAHTSSLYDIQIDSIDGHQIDLGLYRGKKIIISQFDGTAPDNNQLYFLDSLQKAIINIVVIAVPVKDFTGSKTPHELIRLRDSLNLHFLVTMPSFVKKISNTNQMPLFTFLTNSNLNGHFDVEVKDLNQLYFISGKGTLYSILKRETPRNIINAVLNQQVDL